jgi:hypothetical protein
MYLIGLSILPHTSPEELPYKLAYEAHRGTSFSPEVRAKSHQEDFAKTLNSYAEKFESLIKSDEQKNIAIQEFERFKQKYTSLYHAWLHAKSRCLSTMITGGSKFPVRQAEKANAIEHKRSQELTEFENKAVSAITKKIKGLLPDEIKDAEVWDSIKKELYRSIGTILAIHKGESYLSKPLISGALKRFIERMYKNGQYNHVNKALDEIAENQTKHNFIIFAKNNPIWNLRKEPEKVEPKENISLFKAKDLEIINNYEIDRLQLLFNGKPSQDIINYLKSKAFKWSPSNQAWQRQLTNNAITEAKIFLDKFYKNDLEERLRVNRVKAAAKLKLLILMQNLTGFNDFEPTFNQFKNKPKEAIKHLLKVKKGQCINALYRDDIGYIDIVWGENDKNNKGFGLKHIVEKHGKEIKELGFEVEDFIPIVVQFGDLKPIIDKNKIFIEGKRYRVVIKTKWNNKEKQFLLSAFDLRLMKNKKPV